jgi:predicted N-acetyltransferase YhbS
MLRNYRPETDFLLIRDFLMETYRDLGGLLNWRIERWNYARYFVAPYLGAYGQAETPIEGSLQAIRFWEETVGVWEYDEGRIAGVVNMEHPDFEHPGYGEAFLQRHPRYTYFLEEMLDYAEANLVNRQTNTLFAYVFDHDVELQVLVQRRGYVQSREHPGWDSEYVVGALPEQELPAGYLIRSMADENDVERRREIFGRAFNHPDPAEWPSAFAYRELQRAPDYCPDRDLYVVAPDGRFAACCIAWYDDLNRMGILEPVGTHPDFRRLGLAREVVYEAIRRLAALGAERVWVGSGQQFYESIGFRKRYASYRWTKQL